MPAAPPAIRDFPSFEEELRDAHSRVDAYIAAHPDDEAMPTIRDELREVARATTGGRCPTDDELSQVTFGAYAAHELRDHPELARVLGRLADYLHRWPRGVNAPSWP